MFSYLFGFVGTLIAVPLAAAIGVVVRFAIKAYLDSPFYTGSQKTKVSIGQKKIMTDARQRRPSSSQDGPSQLVLDLPHREALGAEDFFVSQSNAALLT